MAEVTKGLENLQEAITACQQASTAVATASVTEAAQARSALESVLASLNEVSDKIFHQDDDERTTYESLQN